MSSLDQQALVDAFDGATESSAYYQELRALIGKNAEAYKDFLLPPDEVKALDKKERQVLARRQISFRNWTWLALLHPMAFLWYRKLWLDGIGALILTMVLDLGFEVLTNGVVNGGIVNAVMWIMFGKHYVMWRYHGMVRKARATIPDHGDRLRLLERRGGVSPVAAWGVAGALAVLLGALLYYTIQAG